MYSYFMPTRVIFGNDAIFELEGILESYINKKMLIVTDPGIISAGLLDTLLKIVSASNIEYKIFSEVEPNPKSRTIEEGLKFAKEFGTDFVIGFGGGSSIDTAKAIAVMLTNAGSILQYEGVGNVPNDPVDLIAIPTTAGTGSEVTASTIITDEATSFKVAIISEKIFPKTAIVDPKLTMGCPKPITSSTAIDALTHAIESYLSKQENGVVADMALKAIALINENIENVYNDGSDLEGRKNLLEAAALAGICFSQTRLGNVHAISQAFGGVFNVPHGFANAVLLPYVLEFNLPAAVGKYCDIARALDVYDSDSTEMENAKKIIDRIKELNRNLGIPKTTKELGINLDSIETLIEDSMRSGNIKVNPRETTADDVKTIIEASFYGQKLEEIV
ncbi:alcohol dehydrogenase, class IV [Bacillus sp. OxB-1]|uniref:iron-containing alcohol dehydrogenase n=1 Tax=Bacillus sp. (strain OxB-1) TaxID=98228 RepID=UPI000581B6F4|nr:iron-containing alcohol dehydrogenase [Bacillus sp. OxB-1]BAQ09343.1 alcohol dehydrogenase, class IV [Bacillus sp. OxB-1]